LSLLFLEKEVPTIVGPSEIYLTIGQSTSITIRSNNTERRVSLTADFQLPEGATFDSDTGTFTWNVTSYVMQPINIT
jgi:hypothetical protein